MLIGVAVVIVGVFTAYQAIKARDALHATAGDLELLSGQLTSGDSAAARRTLQEAQASAEEAHDNTTGPGWWVASKLPVLGDDVHAVQTVSEVADNLTSDVLPGAIEASRTLSPDELRPVNGRVDVQAIARVAPAVVATNEGLQREQAKVAELEPESMLEQVAGPVTELQEKLGEAADLLEKASKAVQLLPSMLGVDGKRTYVVIFQNNAEVRATGGIPGAFAVITANNGRINMEAQGSSGTFGTRETPVLRLTRDERELFDEEMGVYPQDTNFTPDFPRTAQLVQAMWQRVEGTKVDGVLSTDPVALSYVLDGTGPVELTTGEQLTAENAVQLLLNEVYLRLPDPALQDVFFAATARQVFDAITSGRGNPRQVLEGLAQAASEHRVLVWSDHRREQQIIEETPLAGALFTGESVRPHVGVFLNDATGAKMNFYTRHEVDVESVSCASGIQTMRVSVSMRSNAPRNAAQLPDYITGAGVFGVDPGTARANVLVYAPVGGDVDSATLNGEELVFAPHTHDGRPVALQTIDLTPGEEVSMEFVVESDEGQTGAPYLRVTPGAHGDGVGTVSGSSCA